MIPSQREALRSALMEGPETFPQERIDQCRELIRRNDLAALERKAKRIKASLRPWSPPVQRRSMIGRWLRRMDRKRRYRLAQLRLTHHLDLTQDRFHPDGRLHRLEHERRRAWVHDLGEVPPMLLF